MQIEGSERRSSTPSSHRLTHEEIEAAKYCRFLREILVPDLQTLQKLPQLLKNFHGSHILPLPSTQSVRESVVPYYENFARDLPPVIEQAKDPLFHVSKDQLLILEFMGFTSRIFLPTDEQPKNQSI
jgi:hypothetical protein